MLGSVKGWNEKGVLGEVGSILDLRRGVVRGLGRWEGEFEGGPGRWRWPVFNGTRYIYGWGD